MSPILSVNKIFGFLRDTVRGFLDDDCMRMAAALSYYAAFSLPPLLFLLITVLGYFFHSEDVQSSVSQNLVNVIGKENAGIVQSWQTTAGQVQHGIADSIIGLCALAVGASALMSELQSALNKVWQVKPREKNGLVRYLLQKLLSLSMLAIIAALLIFSLAFNAILSAFGEQIYAWFRSDVSYLFLKITHLAMSFILLVSFLALTFKVLPNAPIRWKDVWLGATVTALLFIVGNYLVGLYLGRSNPASAYGAAASLALILIWIYYASMMILLGAEFTRSWAQWHHRMQKAVSGSQPH